MKIAFLALTLSLWSVKAFADDLLFFKPSGPRDCAVDWKPGNTHALRVYITFPEGWTSLDRWAQVAPGGKVVATWSESSGLDLVDSIGKKLWHREGIVTAFRFSSGGDRLAVASRSGIEIVSVGQATSRRLSAIAGAEWLRWMDGGLLARARGHLILIDEAGKERDLVSLPKGAVVAASPRRIVFFARGGIVDLKDGSAPITTRLADRQQVINAELSPDGRRILFATNKLVYLIEGDGRPEVVAKALNQPRSLSFSRDGSAYLWASPGAGAVVAGGKQTPLPEAMAARFRQDGGSELVLTDHDQIFLWNPGTGKRGLVGGISPNDGSNFGGDLAGNAIVAFVCGWSPGVKEHRIPGGRVLPPEE